MQGDDGHRQAAEATSKGSRSFYLATKFLPRHLAQASHSVYWFCRYTDDLVDETSDVEQGRRDLAAWSEALRSAMFRGHSDHPVLALFVDTLDRYAIPRDYPFELIAGMRMDLNGTRYASFSELRVFCYRVASVVGLMMAHVIGFSGGALSYATDLGIAMQLTNILRDVGEDLKRGRIYLPKQEMLRFGYSERELLSCVRNDAFHELMRYQIARARDYYNRSAPGIALLHPDGRFAVQIASDVYRAILRRIEISGYDVFEHRAVVPAIQKYWIALRGTAAPAIRRVLHA